MDIIIQNKTLTDTKDKDNWKCSICSHLNSFLYEECVSCSNKRNKETNQVFNYWICDGCSFYNKKFNTCCEKCTRPRLKMQKEDLKTFNDLNRNKNHLKVEELLKRSNEFCKKCQSKMINGLCLDCDFQPYSYDKERQNYREKQISDNYPQTFQCLKCSKYSLISSHFCRYCENSRPKYYCRFDHTFGNYIKCQICKRICITIK